MHLPCVFFFTCEQQNSFLGKSYLESSIRTVLSRLLSMDCHIHPGSEVCAKCGYHQFMLLHSCLFSVLQYGGSVAPVSVGAALNGHLFTGLAGHGPPAAPVWVSSGRCSLPGVW